MSALPPSSPSSLAQEPSVSLGDSAPSLGTIGAGSSVDQPAAMAQLIDHTFLRPEATRQDIERLCREAKSARFYSVCVNPAWVACAAEQLQGSSVQVVAVVGFPLGANSSAAKAYEARDAVAAGASEIDMVLNLGALKEKNYTRVLEDIQGVVQAVQPVPVKVILETAALNEDQKIVASALAQAAGAAFVKTSTGFGGGGATEADVRLMRRIVGAQVGVKASGGVKTVSDVLKFVAAGANRIGTSSGVEILAGFSSQAVFQEMAQPAQVKSGSLPGSAAPQGQSDQGY
jgi:deoxyribose-phosphate aldolase